MRAVIRKKVFGSEVVISDAVFDIPEGKCTAIIGPSGSGKTTLMRILAGLDREFEGSVENPPERPLILFQEDRLVENISAISNLLAVAPDRRSAERALSDAGLAEDGEKKVSELSGGMRRKLAIARFMLLDGDALFLDEPFRALDDVSRRGAARRLSSFRAGRTMVFISHDEEDISLLGADFTICLP